MKILDNILTSKFDERSNHSNFETKRAKCDLQNIQFVMLCVCRTERSYTSVAPSIGT